MIINVHFRFTTLIKNENQVCRTDKCLLRCIQLAAQETLKIEKNAGVTSISFPKRQLKSCYVMVSRQRFSQFLVFLEQQAERNDHQRSLPFHYPD
jgi:hypothetical protein